MNKNNQTAIWIGAVVVVILIAIGLYVHNQNQSGEYVAPQGTSQTATAPADQTPSTTPVVTPGGPGGSISYSAAVTKYKNSRIQFDTHCAAIPSAVVFRNPATIMLDNRSNASAKIVIDQKTYSLGAYGYQIITLNETASPSISYIDCNASKNVGKITIEK